MTSSPKPLSLSIRTLKAPRYIPILIHPAPANTLHSSFQAFKDQAIKIPLQSSQRVHAYPKKFPRHHQPAKMKSYITIVLAILATGVISSPHPDPMTLAQREVCNHPGECGWTESGQCEYHCDGYGGFQYMQSCGWARKRCCCVEST